MPCLRPIVFLVLASTITAQNTPLEQAWTLVSRGDSQTATRVLKELVSKEPGSAEARLLLGSLLMEAGDRVGSIEQLTEGARLSPRSAEAQNALAEALIRFGDSKSARAPLERAVALQPRFAIAQLNLGQVLAEANELTAAATHLDRAIALLGNSPDAADAYYLRAKVYSAQDQTAEAARALEQATRLRPDFPEAWSDLGQARKLLLDDEGALAAYRRAVEQNPSAPVARYRLGAELVRQGKATEAIEHLREADRLNPEDQSTLNALQMALRQAGRTSDATIVKDQLTGLLVSRDRANQDSLAAVKLNNEAATHEKSGDLAGAVAKYKEASRLYPQHTGIRVNYAIALLKIGKWKDGLEQLHVALEQKPADSQIRKAWQDALAQAPPEFRRPYAN